MAAVFLFQWKKATLSCIIFKIQKLYLCLKPLIFYNYLAKFPATFNGSQVNENGGA